MPKNNNLQDYLKDLYEGIKSVKPSASKDPQQFRSEVESLAHPADATATSADIRLGETAYTSEGKVTGTIEDYDGSIVAGGIAEYTPLQSNLPTFLGWEIVEHSVASDIITINGKELTIKMAESLNISERDLRVIAHVEQSKASEGSGFKVTAYSSNGCEIWYALYTSDVPLSNADYSSSALDGGSFDVVAKSSNYVGWDDFELEDPNAEAERLYLSLCLYPEDAKSLSSTLSGTIRLVWEAIS